PASTLPARRAKHRRSRDDQLLRNTMNSSEPVLPVPFALTIRARLTLWNCALLIISLMTLAGVLQWIARTLVMESVDRELAARASIVRELWISQLPGEGMAGMAIPSGSDLTPRIVLSGSAMVRPGELPATSRVPARHPSQAFRPFNRFLDR